MKPSTHDSMPPMSRELSVLDQIAGLFLDTHTTVAYFSRAVLRKANELIPSDLSFVGIVQESEEGERWVLVRDPKNDIIGAEAGEWQRYITSLKVGDDRLPAEERSFVGYVAHKRAPYLSDDVRKETYYRPSNTEIRSELAVPVLYQGEVIAVINLESKTIGFFTEQHQAMLVLLSKLIALHLHSLMVSEGLRKPYLELLEKVAARVSTVGAGVPVEATNALHEIAEILATYLNSGLCQIWTHHGLTDLAVYGQFPRNDAPYIADVPGEQYARRAIKERRLLKLGHAHRPPHNDHDVMIPALAAPIMISGEPLGAIVLACRQIGTSEDTAYYTAEDELLIQSVQSPIAAALEFKRQETARREDSYQRSKKLSEIAKIFTNHHLKEVLKKTVINVPALCESQYCSVFLWNETRKQFVLAASQGADQDLIDKAVYSPGEGLTGWVGLHGKPLLLDSRAQDALARVAPDLEWKSKFSEYSGEPNLTLQPFAAVPIFGEGRVIGVLRVTGRDGGRYTEADEIIMTVVAAKISSAISYSQAYKERLALLRGFRDLMAYTREFSRDAATIEGFKQAFLKEAAAVAKGVFGASVVIIYSVSGDKLDYPPVWKGKLFREDLMNRPVGPSDVPSAILDQRQSKFWADVRSELLLRDYIPDAAPPKPRFVDRERILASAGIPLEVGDTIVGVMFLNYRHSFTFDSDRKELIEAFGTQVALSLETIVLHEHIRESASREKASELSYQLHDAAGILSTGVLRRAGHILDRLSTSGYLRSDDMRADLRSLEKNASNCVIELKGIIGELQGTDTNQLPWYDLIQEHLLQVKPPDLKVTFQPGDKAVLSAPADRHIYLILRELLSNTLLHSRARQISIYSESNATRLRLVVEDNGIGFNPERVKRGLGLVGVRGRLKKLKGTLEIHSKPGDTQFVIDIPVPVDYGR